MVSGGRTRAKEFTFRSMIPGRRRPVEGLAYRSMSRAGGPGAPLRHQRGESRGGLRREASRPSFAPSRSSVRAIFITSARVWMRQFKEKFLLLSFDNHPDWDIRSPKWSCGAWINRALEMPNGARREHLGLRQQRMRVAPAQARQPEGRAGRAGSPFIPGAAPSPSTPTGFCPPRRKPGAPSLPMGLPPRGRKNLRHGRSRLPDDGGSGDQLGERPVHRRRHRLGARRAAREDAAHRRRPVRRLVEAVYATLPQRIAGWFDHPAEPR